MESNIPSLIPTEMPPKMKNAEAWIIRWHAKNNHPAAESQNRAKLCAGRLCAGVATRLGKATAGKRKIEINGAPLMCLTQYDYRMRVS